MKKQNRKSTPKSENAVNVVVFDTNQKPRSADISGDELSRLQRIVGGFIEMATFNEYTLIFDEEGLLKGLPRNPHFPQLVGPVIVTKTRNGKCVGLTDGELTKVQKQFRPGTVSFMI